MTKCIIYALINSYKVTVFNIGFVDSRNDILFDSDSKSLACVLMTT